MNTLLHKIHLTDDERHQLVELRRMRRQARAAKAHEIGQKVADQVASTMGSWSFIIIQTTILAAWITFNLISSSGWDPYPFILLNLALSFQAAYAAPFIMMSQNRQSEIDRKRAIDDYEVNCKAELEIELLHEKIDLLRQQEITRLTAIIEDLSARLADRPAQGG